MAAGSSEVLAMAPWTEAQLDEAIARPTDGDVLSAAAAGVRHGSITREEAAFTLMVLVGAGAETTTSLIGNAIGILAARPILQEELRAEPAKVRAFVEEVLRFESPFRYHPRTASRASELGGVRIPEGALVMLLWSAANRDEAVFDEPDEVRIDRPNSHLHFGFGRGIHHCVGARLARLEATVVLTRLLGCTGWFAPNPDHPPRWAESIWIRRHEHLPIAVQAR
jgi:cytochrome P450